MMSKLDELTASARAGAPSFAWSDERAARVLGTMLIRREHRVRRHRVVRRALVGASGVATVLLILLKGASATPSTMSSNASVLAESHSSDGGYARD